MSTLMLEALDVRYGGVQAVRGLSFEVAPGEIVGLIGANGAGKSSTLHAIMGVAPIVGGDVRLGGESLRGRRPEDIARSGVALVPEGRRIFAELTVEENLRLGLAARRSRGPADGVLKGVYELFPIVEEFRARNAGALSGGQQQQLAIARALVAEPDVLLLDEPSLGLAPAVVDIVFDALVAIRERGGRRSRASGSPRRRARQRSACPLGRARSPPARRLRGAGRAATDPPCSPAHPRPARHP